MRVFQASASGSEPRAQAQGREGCAVGARNPVPKHRIEAGCEPVDQE